ncbi:MAG: hypothetical protein MJ181_01925 [Treponema sp.]|uniref:hypothetical protein n=1 Tax=Treponema sp. TaxID=166 RepID=UPI00298E7D6C|nr:hypothetical protein [Treponema sp.]MCQ2596581.1 hypothetical protein [Treponema sp.]MCQ2601604.1 hypothetical protein [Treponema sp.]
MDIEILKIAVNLYNKISDLKKIKKNLESIKEKKDFDSLAITLSKLSNNEWESKSEIFDVSEFKDFFEATVMALYALVINKINDLEIELNNL